MIPIELQDKIFLLVDIQKLRLEQYVSDYVYLCKKDLSLTNAIRHANLTGMKHLIRINGGLGVNIYKYYALFREAVTHYNLEIIIYLINKFNDYDDACNYVLQLACQTCNLELVKYLISVNVDINSPYNDALQYACKYGSLPIVQCLVEQGANLDTAEYSIYYAASNNHFDIVKYLINKNVNFKMENSIILLCAIHHDNIIMLKYLISLGATFTTHINRAMYITAENDNLEMLLYLIELGADISHDRYCIMRSARRYKSSAIIKYLLQFDLGIHDKFYRNLFRDYVY